MTKIITVVGATGGQGGSVARMFLSDPKLKAEWKVRGMTRDPTKESSKNMEALGAEMVKADIDDPASLEKAFEGADAVFAVTNYWESLSKDKEIAQGKNMADAAKKQNVKQYIWSSLLNIDELTGGILPNVYHFDSKAIVEKYCQDINLNAAYFLAGFYMPNFKAMHLLRPSEDGTYTLGLAECTPTAKIPLFNPKDTGKYVKAMALNWDKVKGKRVLGAGEYQTPEQIVATFVEVFPKAGKGAKFFRVPEEVFRGIMTGQGYPEYVATELLENFRLLGEFGYYGGEPLEWTHSLLEDKPMTFKEFVKEEWAELE